MLHELQAAGRGCRLLQQDYATLPDAQYLHCKIASVVLQSATASRLTLIAFFSKYLSAAGIVPSSSKTYTLAAINAALEKARGVSAVVQCSNGALDEAWYYFDVKGSVQTGTFVPTNQGMC